MGITSSSISNGTTGTNDNDTNDTPRDEQQPETDVQGAPEQQEPTNLNAVAPEDQIGDKANEGNITPPADHDAVHGGALGDTDGDVAGFPALSGSGEGVDPSMTPQGHREPAAPKGRILGFDEPLAFDAEVKDNYAVVTEDVYRGFVPNRARRMVYQQVLRKGQQVPLTMIRRMEQEQQAAEQQESDEPQRDQD